MPVKHKYQVKRVENPEEMEEALRIRFDVFIKEQGVSPDVESDDLDAVDPHWLVSDEQGVYIATARLTNLGNGIGKLERVAVMDQQRQQGIGRVLIERIEADARQGDYNHMVVHAQTQCTGFYERLGYHITDPTVFEEDNIPHVRMEKAL